MTLLSITKFLRLCFICRNHIPVLFPFMTYHRVCNQSNTTGVVNGVRTAYPSGSSEITSRFLVRFMLHDLSFFCVVFCKLFLVLFRLVILFVVIDFPLVSSTRVRGAFNRARHDDCFSLSLYCPSIILYNDKHSHKMH
jgi:hypothetical protein